MTERERRGRERDGAARDGRASGLTLIEISLLVGLLGLAAIYLVEEFVADLKMQHHDSQIVGAINDAQGILAASHVYWYSIDPSTTSAFQKWPHTSTGGTTSVDIAQLWNASNKFLAAAPPTRFPVECNGSACSGYRLTGWDTSAKDTSATVLDEELQIYFEVPEERHARAIAAQLPHGSYERPTATTYRVTGRIDSTKYSTSSGKPCVPPPAEGTSGGDMRLCGENRHMRFGSGVRSLKKVARIAHQAQDPSILAKQALCTETPKLKGAGIGMDERQISFAACGSLPGSDPSATLVMEEHTYNSSGTYVVVPRMTGTFLDGDGNESKFTYSMENPVAGTGSTNYARVPYFEFDADPPPPGVSTTTGRPVLKLQAHNSFQAIQREGTNVTRTYPAGWDLYLMDTSSMASTCHRPVQQRLCRFRDVIASGYHQWLSNKDVKYDGLCFYPATSSTTAPVPSGC